MVKVEYGVVSSYVPSLKTVASDIAYALNKLGHSARYYSYQVPFYKAKNLFSKAIIFIPFDPVYVSSWCLMARDYSKAHIPNVIYTTVEGIPKEKMIRDWLRSDLIYIACSQYVKEMLEKVNIPVEDVIPHGVNLTHVNQAEPMKEYLKLKLNAKVVFGTVCSTLPRKGLKTLAEIAKMLEKELPEAKFYVYTRLIGENPFTGLKNVFVDSRFGRLDRTKILSLIGSFDYYLCPSYAEGFGLPLLEAHALGIPVICGEYKPLTEVTCPEASLYVPIYDVIEQDDGYGIMFTYHLYDANEMASKVKEAYEIYTCNQEEYKQMCSKAKEHAKQFDILKTYSKFLDRI